MLRGQRVKDRIVRVEQCEGHFASLSGEEIMEVAPVAEHSVAVPGNASDFGGDSPDRQVGPT